MAFTYGVKLPGFDNKKIWVNEITSKLYKDLVKSLYNNDSTEFVYHLNQLIEHASPGILQGGLNVVDKIILLLQIRSICISPDLKLKAKCVETKKEFEYTVRIEDLVFKLESAIYNKTISYEKIVIKHSIVKAIDEIYFVNLESEKAFSYQLASCIDKLIINNKEINFKDIGFERRVEIVDTLPLFLTSKIYESLLLTETELSKTKLLVIPSPYSKTLVVDLPVTSNTNILLEFCKLIFNDDLINLYKINLNLISKANFTPDYADSITPAEQLLYWNLYVQQVQEEIAASNTKTNNSNIPNFDKGIPNGFA
jgi:hypothetical protein